MHQNAPTGAFFCRVGLGLGTLTAYGSRTIKSKTEKLRSPLNR